MTKKEFNSSIRTNCLGEFSKESDIVVIYVDFDENSNELIAGDITNAGIIPIVRLPYDNDFSIDKNIESVVEMLIDEGYYLL